MDQKHQTALQVRNKRKKHNRCRRCGLPPSLCICAMAPRLDTDMEFIIVSHVKEMIRASNTARLVQLALPATRILLRGVREQPVSPLEFQRPDRFVCLLFPSPDAREIDAGLLASLRLPPVFVIADGSWRQAAGTVRRQPGLQDLPRFKLPPGPESRYRLRRQTYPDRVSTFEAVARVIGLMEGSEKQNQLEEYFEEMVRRSLMASGRTGQSVGSCQRR